MSQRPPSLVPLDTGGAGRSRTDLHGFAIRCITALLPRPAFKRYYFVLLRQPSSYLKKTGAAEESRTLDLYLGKVSLYQLSYCRVKQSAHYRPGKEYVNIRPIIFPNFAWRFPARPCAGSTPSTTRLARQQPRSASCPATSCQRQTWASSKAAWAMPASGLQS